MGRMQWRANHSVLVVDDNDAGRYAVSHALRSAGFRTVEARSGAQALELAGYVSAVVLDVHLPDVHGFEVCRLIRQRQPNVPVVHVSAVYVEEPSRAAGLAAGASAYFVRPVDPSELTHVLEHVLGRNDEALLH